ncbi:NAD-dependent DNA ligase [Bacillus phage G]|uniref:DNA ligase (NAD(+)) n=1 Tax=Bacillus phage G TaxID=2884420 RepID=G3M9X7_9CAUD|nr:NAD-dependent DNA ligase [Bacillus phage G]AEO93495.1 gp236 [Bacillus phage G]
MSKAILTKMEKLSELIEYHNTQYFTNKKPEIEDAVFDQLVRQLEFLEKKYPQYAKSNSPTKQVGEKIEINTFETTKHRKRMPSLGKSMSTDELYEFAVKMYLGGARDFVLEPKIDGLALSLWYKEGNFVKGVTRGDGEYGDDVTQTVLSIKDIPKTLPNNFTGEVRGEAYMKKSDFIAYNETRVLMGLKKYANTRNLASGILKRKEVTEENSLISFLAYSIIDEDHDFDLYSDGIQKLDEYGFNTSLLIVSKTDKSQAPQYRLHFIDRNFPHTSLKDILEDLVNIWTELRPKLDFDIDGLVLKANKVSIQETFGESKHSPNWATAFKFPAEEGVTTLLDVVWTMGNKGNITPNARIEPIELMGVTVSGTTLHNLDELERLDLMIGDTIIVSRRGDVIPKVESVIKELRTGEEIPIKIPMVCPTDGVPTVIDGSFLRCSNGDNCEYMKFAKVQNFIHSMEIDELGPIVIEKMLEANIISNLTDLYDVKPEQIEPLERMGKKSANKIVKNIQKSKDNQLHKVIAGLTIKNVSISTAENLVAKYKNLESLLYCTVDELQTIPDVGPKTALNVYQWFQKEENREIIYKLIDKEVGFYKEQVLESDKLSNVIFCFTGKMVNFKRKELEKMVKDNGGSLGGVNKKLNYLVTGEDAGSKLSDAEELNANKGTSISIITETEFLDMLK